MDSNGRSYQEEPLPIRPGNYTRELARQVESVAASKQPTKSGAMLEFWKDLVPELRETTTPEFHRPVETFVTAKLEVVDREGRVPIEEMEENKREDRAMESTDGSVVGLDEIFRREFPLKMAEKKQDILAMESTDGSVVGLDEIFRQETPHPGSHNYKSPLHKMLSAGNFQVHYPDLTSKAFHYPTHAPVSEDLPTLPGAWSPQADIFSSPARAVRGDSLAPAPQQQQQQQTLPRPHSLQERVMPFLQQQQLVPRPHYQSFREQAISNSQQQQILPRPHSLQEQAIFNSQQQQILPRPHSLQEQAISNSQQQQLVSRPHDQSFREQAIGVPRASSMDGSSRSPKEEESHEEKSREKEEPRVEEKSLIRYVGSLLRESKNQIRSGTRP